MRRHALFIPVALLTVAFFGSLDFARGQCPDGRCVDLAKCRSNYGHVSLIDLRVGVDIEGECDHYLQVCCEESEIIEEPVTGTPGVVSVAPPNGGKWLDCGHRNPDGVGFRTVNGAHNESEFGEFPWMVALLEKKLHFDLESHTFLCGGSLIAPNVVLTAAHCVYNKTATPESITVRAGEWDTRSEGETIPFQEQKVQRIIVQPNYNSAVQFNDIALLVLEQSFVPDENVQLICLPPQGQTFTDKNCFATGWGKTEFNSDSYQVILKKVQLPMVSHSECQKALRRTRLGANFRLHNSFACAGGDDGVDTCTGDGGSPLMCPFPQSETRYYQAGIVAWGIGCGTAGIPGVYAKNSMFTEWINQELQNLGADNDLFGDYV